VIKNVFCDVSFAPLAKFSMPWRMVAAAEKAWLERDDIFENFWRGLGFPNCKKLRIFSEKFLR